MWKMKKYLTGTQFSTLKSDGINDPEKYNNTEVKYRATFYGCHTAFDPAVVKYKNHEKK
jgi:hypothetical protein